MYEVCLEWCISTFPKAIFELHRFEDSCTITQRNRGSIRGWNSILIFRFAVQCFYFTILSDKSAFFRKLYSSRIMWKFKISAFLTTMRGMSASSASSASGETTPNEKAGKREFIITPRKSHHIQIHSVLSFLLLILWTWTGQKKRRWKFIHFLFVDSC